MASGFLASGQAFPASQGCFQLFGQSSSLAFLIPLSPAMLVKTDPDIYIYVLVYLKSVPLVGCAGVVLAGCVGGLCRVRGCAGVARGHS